MDTRGVKNKRDALAASGAAATAGSRTVFSLSEEETLDLGRGLGRALKGGELLLLEGDLGYGKTVFARGIALGPRDSPGGGLVSVVHARPRVPGRARSPLPHRLVPARVPEDEVGALGIEEILTVGGVVLVEWGERLPPFLKRGATTIRFHDVGEGSRRIEILAEPATTPRPRGDA